MCWPIFTKIVWYEMLMAGKNVVESLSFTRKK